MYALLICLASVGFIIFTIITIYFYKRKVKFLQLYNQKLEKIQIVKEREIIKLKTNHHINTDAEITMCPKCNVKALIRIKKRQIVMASKIYDSEVITIPVEINHVKVPCCASCGDVFMDDILQQDITNAIIDIDFDDISKAEDLGLEWIDELD